MYSNRVLCYAKWLSSSLTHGILKKSHFRTNNTLLNALMQAKRLPRKSGKLPMRNIGGQTHWNDALQGRQKGYYPGQQ